MVSKKGILTKLTIVVIKTTLETKSASLSYLAAITEALTAAGIAESNITTDLYTPSKLNTLTARKPNARPIPTRKNEARSVVGTDESFTFERL